MLQTRTQETGIIQRRRECTDCQHRFTTHELPPSAFNYARKDVYTWASRQTGPYKTMVRQRAKLKQLMLVDRSAGETCVALAQKYGMSVHMIRYYTRQPRRPSK